MIRKFNLNLDEANEGKSADLLAFHIECSRIVNYYIGKFFTFDKLGMDCYLAENLDADTWLSKRAQKSMARQAVNILRTQRAKRAVDKRNGTKLTLWKQPVFTGKTIILSETNVTIELARPNHFDAWIRFGSLGNHLNFWMPSKRYEYFNSFILKGWELSNSASLRLENGTFYLDVALNKAEPLKHNGSKVGGDIGYKKLFVMSNGEQFGTELPAVIGQIVRHKRGSKAHQRAIETKEQYINTEINKIDVSSIGTLVVEDLKNVKYKSKLSRKVMSKLQYWTYSQVLQKLAGRAERECFSLVRVNPAYTSQQCSHCGEVDSGNRKGEIFKCVKCSHTEDADFNASCNILMRYLTQEVTVPGTNNSKTTALDFSRF